MFDGMGNSGEAVTLKALLTDIMKDPEKYRPLCCLVQSETVWRLAVAIMRLSPREARIAINKICRACEVPTNPQVGVEPTVTPVQPPPPVTPVSVVVPATCAVGIPPQGSRR